MTRLGYSVSNSTFRLKVLVLVFKLYVKFMYQISDLWLHSHMLKIGGVLLVVTEFDKKPPAEVVVLS